MLGEVTVYESMCGGKGMGMWGGGEGVSMGSEVGPQMA